MTRICSYYRTQNLCGKATNQEPNSASILFTNKVLLEHSSVH